MKNSNGSMLLHVIAAAIIINVSVFTAAGGKSPYQCTSWTDSCIARGLAGYPCGDWGENSCEYLTGYSGGYKFCVHVDDESVCNDIGGLSVISTPGYCSAQQIPCFCDTGSNPGVNDIKDICI